MQKIEADRKLTHVGYVSNVFKGYIPDVLAQAVTGDWLGQFNCEGSLGDVGRPTRDR